MNIELNIKNLQARTKTTEILHGINLTVKKGEVHAIMGPNGSGKSTLAQIILGHPKFEVTRGVLEFKKKNLLLLSPDQRANLGLFLAWQNPKTISGVKIAPFLKQALEAKRRSQKSKKAPLKVREYQKLLLQTMENLKMKPEFAERYLNEGFSGGEKKKSEILQMSLLKPDIAILDEIDSGLDVDALKEVCQSISLAKSENNFGLVLITHYPRILQYLKPGYVHILLNGKIVKSGNWKLAQKIEQQGYAAFR
ncbi:MAG: Fe-S cluster assembly ATPase SufC [Candidatus Kerfeldbacteria bacterium RIFOXYA2_FULL_38_24]|uniref:Fe-S cluster assembly ATPase SufC n=1 Tax=Candidatus Kerfeldbacteria bacterium RIFOXYB2_FULL_38_14 TaxID=1798547 RepID=A0A1G2BFZ8_9BACT|nr:MAG: Fe-S cluster assembly ATPase SufC [Candidatus Kerfeldbacteria bacterium RIFOXYA2_FULL_38_24]OGY88111.1 MAG: Fe-S cluster assembly ATPase SufC [Candidatus Kerfeldbacteria bacterium RIFOXYB2_FULL_38_14]OGY88735.1 MAG: Fe-S cluster assembly ATPase SufC [Candidatus Kerfeldbacteria bacterium RIFOXYC2_FULL_38_9]